MLIAQTPYSWKRVRQRIRWMVIWKLERQFFPFSLIRVALKAYPAKNTGKEEWKIMIIRAWKSTGPLK